MSSRVLVRNLAIGASLVILLLIAAALTIVRTAWFQSYVKEKIVAAAGDATGGRVEIGSFGLDLPGLRATIDNIVIHGLEPAGSPPYLEARRIVVDLRFFTNRHFLDISSVSVDQPQANIVALPDGTTNIPKPRSPSTESPLKTVVDLAVGRFALNEGVVNFGGRQQRIDVHGTNLRAQLAFDNAAESYRGEIRFAPVFVRAQNQTAVPFTIDLPIVLHDDRVELHEARISSPQSELAIDAVLENLQDPRLSAQMEGHLAFADLRNAAGVSVEPSRGLPSSVRLEANIVASGKGMDVKTFQAALGRSTIEAHGNTEGRGSDLLAFQSRIDSDELRGLLHYEGTSLPHGLISFNGHAGFNTDSKTIELRELELSGFGLDLHADASLADFARYQIRAQLERLDLRNALRNAGEQPLPYDAVVSGSFEATGSLSGALARSLSAQAHLNLAPGSRGLPLSGRLEVNYLGGSDRMNIVDSYATLPHTKLTVNGSTATQLNVSLTTTDLGDLLPVVPDTTRVPVTFQGGQAIFTGRIRGPFSAPQMNGHLAANRFAVENRLFDSLEADAVVSNRSATISNATLARDRMSARFSGALGLRDWKATPASSLTLDATLQTADLADVFALAGQPASDSSGALDARLSIHGSVGNPAGSLTLEATNGTIRGEPFQQLQARADLSDRLVRLSQASLATPAGRLDLSGEFRHPASSFVTGDMRVSVQTSSVDLARVATLQKQRPNTLGTVQWKMDAAGTLSQQASSATGFVLTNLSATASLRGLRSEGQNYGDATIAAQTSGQEVHYNVTSDFAGSAIRVNGSTRLAAQYPTTADATLNNLAVERVLALAHRTGVPAKGNLSGNLRFSGTLDHPQGDVDLRMNKAAVYGQPLDDVQLRAAYVSHGLELKALRVVSGPSRIELTGRYDAAPGDWLRGNVKWQACEGHIDLARVRKIQELRPTLAGVIDLRSTGEASISDSGVKLILRNLDADLEARHLGWQRKTLGDLTLTAKSNAGRVAFTLDSNLAQSNIHGKGSAALTADFPVDAQLEFHDLAWTRIQSLLQPSAAPAFDALADGQMSIQGPVHNAGQLDGKLALTRLQFNNLPATSAVPKVNIQNQGPIQFSLRSGVIHIESLHLTGPQTDLTASGSLPFPFGQPASARADVSVKGGLNLDVLHNFSQEIRSAGNVALTANIRGDLRKPDLTGQVDLHNASLNYSTFYNGISNANGTIQLNDNGASIRNLTAESGGGKLTVSGSATMRDQLRFGLRVHASRVRMLLPPGVGVVADADLNLSGTPQMSVAGGTVTVDRINYTPQTDLGAILSRGTPNVESVTASSFLNGMKMDIRVQTTSGTTIQSKLAENLQADANLQLRGTAANPGAVGRITISRGQLLFFGSNYTVNNGSIAFYNTSQIQPVVDLSLETQTQGVDVILKVTGPADNLQLSYTSNPPLQFQQIIALLAAGTTPTSDPTLLANQPSQPPQSFEQMGESAVLGAAVANPIASRLQRVFGITQLNISPTIASGTEVQTNLTLQQRVSNNITFTYITAVNDPNATIVRIELALSPRWSADVGRDQFGIVSVNLIYKRQIR